MRQFIKKIKINFKKHLNTTLYNSIYALILLSLFLSLEFVIPNNLISNSLFSNHLNLLKIPYHITKLYPNKLIISDELVYDKMIYENVTFDGVNNYVNNYSFNGVYNLTDGVVVKISKNSQDLYTVLIQGVDDFTYEYANLKSVDTNIYSFVKSQTILGESCYDSSTNNYFFVLKIMKKGVYYEFYQHAKN